MAGRRILPPSPTLNRNSPNLPPKVEIFIVCEGENTEPEYFDSCIDEYGNGLVKLHVVPGAGVPITLVNTAIELRERLKGERQRSKNSYDACFRVWAVFDRDEHPRVNEALNKARAAGVDVAFSDPCFELWPLLHLLDYGGQDHRHALQARLSAHMPTYDHENGAVIDFALIKENYALASQRADRLLLARERENCPNGRPSTTVGRLVEKIIQNGKKWAR